MCDPRRFVLNVNDDEASRYLVSRVLEQAGFEVVEVGSGREALARARELPQLVVLDIKLPDISGLEVCRRLKRDPLTRGIPILQTSAAAVTTGRRVAGLDSGADAYLAQPIEPAELVATVRSLLRTQRAEQELRAAGEEWQRTFDAISDGVAILSRDGRVLRCNRAMLALSGHPAAEAAGDGSRLRPPDDPTTIGLVNGVMHTGQRSVAELRVSDRLYRLAADPIPDATGALSRVVLVVADITDRKQLEEEHRRRAEQLAELDRRKDEFLAMLAHELRNPLNAIAAANSLMDRTGAQDARNVRLRNTIRRQTRQLVRLVDDLLEVSRVTRGTMRLQRESADLAGVLRSAIDTCLPMLEARNQQLDVEVPDEPLALVADTLRLEQVFVNLLQNAIKYSEPGGRISVSCRVAAGGSHPRVAVHVKDNGIGIPPDQLDSVFDLFVQVDQSLARSLGGLGLGLTIARRLVELHGGTVRALSEGPGRGAEFIVELPLDERAAGGRVERDAAPAMGASAESLTIVVIEDNADAREMLQAWLTELGHRVFTAEDGIDGLDLARSIRPDVALVDIGLPGIDGYQVAQTLRSSAECRGTWLIAMTGYGRPEDSARAREAGFDLHLVKPIQPERLAGIIQAPRA